MGYQIRCPVCGDTFNQPQGLHGHLRFSHNLHGDELDEIYEKAQSQEYMDFLDEEEPTEEEAEAEEEANAEGQKEGFKVQDLPEAAPVDDEEAVAGAFDWEDRLGRMDDLRSDLDRLDRSTGRLEYADESRSAGVITGFLGETRDEGAKEAKEALDDIEMEVRERLGASEEDRKLRRRVDESLDQMEALVRCREQREAIKEKFSGAKAERRIERLDQKEAEIRAHIREQWDAGKPTEELDEDDRVREVESE